MTKIRLFNVLLLVTCVCYVCTGSAVMRLKSDMTPSPTTNNPNSLSQPESYHKDIIIERLKKSMEINGTMGYCGVAPCGWCPYDANDNPHDFISNPRCECRSHQRCLRERPNYFGSFYIYYCSDRELEDDYYDSCLPYSR